MCDTWYTPDFIVVGTDIKHVPLRGTKACILAYREPASRVCSQQLTARFTSASVAIFLASHLLLKASEEVEIIVAHTAIQVHGLQ